MDNNEPHTNGSEESSRHAVHWNDLLPYPVEEGSEYIDALMADVKGALEACDLMALSCCCTRLQHMLDLKLHLEKEQWKHIILLCYELATKPPIEHSPTMHDWSSLLLRILKLPICKQYIQHIRCHLSSCSIDLELEWRPMYEVILNFLYRASREAKLYTDENGIKALVRLAELCRKFLPKNAGEELQAEIGKFLVPTQPRLLAQYISMLVVFLPNGQWSEGVFALIEPTSGVLWSSASKRLEALNMLLLARLTKGHLPISWTAYGPFLFNVLRRHLKLPGPESGPKPIDKWNPEEKPGNRIVRSMHSDFIKHFARWFVRALRDGDELLSLLKMFAGSVDSFCHPSNGGSWSSELAHLFYCLVEAMNKRVFRHGLAYTLPPLSQETIDSFCEILWPALDKLVFSKNFLVAIGAQEAVKCLCNLSAPLVIPRVVLLVEGSLASLTEPHRTNASIGLLVAIARKLVTMPLGLTTTVNLLHAVLPGIDANDPFKTVSTLAFISNTLTVTPLHDLTKTLVDESVEATAGLESFVLLFLEQAFRFIESLPRDAAVSSPSTSLLFNTLDIFFMQLSPELTALALERILRWLRESNSLQAAEAIGILVGYASIRSADLGKVISLALNECAAQIEKGSGVEEHATDEACSKLLCYLHILHRCVKYDCTASSIVQFKTRIIEFMAFALRSCKQKNVVLLLAKSAEAYVKALCGFYPKDWSSLQPSRQVEPEDFGRLYRLTEVEIDWHVPQEQDLLESLELCKAFLAIALTTEFQRTRLLFMRKLLKAVLSLRTNTIFSKQPTSDVDDLFAQVIDSLLAEQLSNVENKGIFISTFGIALIYRGIGRESYSSNAQSVQYMKSSVTYYKKDPLKPRYWYIKRAYLQHLCRIEKMGYRDVEATPRFGEIVERLHGFAIDQIGELYEDAQIELGSVAYGSAKLTREFLSWWTQSLADPDASEDALKALLGLRGSNLMTAISSDWSFLSSFLECAIGLNDRAGIEKIPQIYDLITDLFVESARSFTSPPGQVRCNAWLEKNLQVTIDADKFKEQRTLLRVQVCDKMLGKFGTSSWRKQVMIGTFFLILVDPTDTIPPELIMMFLKGVASDVADVRFSCLQAAKVVLHTWSLQNLCSKLAIDPALIVEGLKRDLIEEADDPGKLQFRVTTCRHVQSLADVIGPDAMLKHVLSVASAWPAIWTPGMQRASAEWIGGLLKSTLYYTNDVPSTLLEFVKLAWSKCSIDASRYWFGALLFACRGRTNTGPVYEFVKDSLLNATNSSSSADLAVLVMSMLAVVKGSHKIDASELLPCIASGLFASTYLVVRREASMLFREIVKLSGITFPPLRLESSDQLKSLIELVHTCMHDPVFTGIWPQLPSLLSTLLAAHHSDEIEMQLATKLVCKRAAWYDYCPSLGLASAFVKAVAEVAFDAGKAVHVRKLAIEVLGIFYSRNFALFDEPMSRAHLELILPLLGDAQIDVREAACLVLTPFLHTQPSLSASLAQALLPLLRSTLPSLKSPSDIPARHALILRASSLILSTPYRMPSWAPPLLLLLTRYLPDRAAIQGTVRKTFSEFKRTHLDSWAVERLLFSEEELDAISELLVSPSYYA